MKNRMKRITALIVTIAMSVSMVMTPSLNAMAVSGETIPSIAEDKVYQSQNDESEAAQSKITDTESESESEQTGSVEEHQNFSEDGRNTLETYQAETNFPETEQRQSDDKESSEPKTDESDTSAGSDNNLKPENNSDLKTSLLDTIRNEISGNDIMGENIIVTAAVDGETKPDSLWLFYRQLPDQEYTSVEMTQVVGQDNPDSYQVVLERDELYTDSLEWFTQAFFGEQSVKSSDEDTVLISSVDSDEASPLLITEAVQASPKGAGYTWFEVYNNANEAVNLKDYIFYYVYPTGSWLEWFTDGYNSTTASKVPSGHISDKDVILQPGESCIFWPGGTVYSESKETAMREYYGISQNVQVIHIKHGGFHASQDRTVRIGKSTDDIIAECSVSGSDNPAPAKKVSDQFTYRKDGNMGYKVSTQAEPTPGMTASWQMPDQPVDLSAETLLTNAASEELEDRISFSVDVSGALGAVNIYLSYQQAGLPAEKVQMKSKNKSAEATFSVDLSKDLLWSDEVTWHVESSDGKLTENITMAVNHGDLDYTKEPPLIFTEVLPVHENGQYTYAEIYNNSNQTINLGYYTLYYQYPTDAEAGKVSKTWTINAPDIYMEPGKSVVLWLSNNGTTVEQFNTNFGTELVENKDIVRIDYAGFHGSDWRKLSIGRAFDKVIASVTFNENGADCKPGENTAIQYTYPKSGDYKESIKVSNKLQPSPGNTHTWQVPSEDKRVNFPGYPEYPDTGASPVVKERTDNPVPASISEGEELFAAFDCTDAIGLTSMAIKYRFDNEETFRTVYEAKQRVNGRFFARIPANEILGHKSLEFYVEGYNLYRSTKTKTYTVGINGANDFEGIRLNVNDASVVNGVKTITANNGKNNKDTKILINNKEEDTAGVLENGAFLSLETGGQDNYFKNVVTAPYGENNREIISYLGKWTNLADRAFLVDNKYFAVDENGNYVVTFTIWAGDSGTPFEDIYQPSENHEDFTVNNVKLVLANGEVIGPDRAMQDYTYSGDSFQLDLENPEIDRTYKIGDTKNGTMAPSLELHFTIPADKLTAVGTNWDTSKLIDGVYEVKAVSEEKEATANVTVDNTAPVIRPGIQNHDVLTGDILFDPEITDTNGIQEQMTWARLDGKTISLPYKIASKDMEAGEHTFTVTAYDICGNKTENEVTFTTNTVNPSGITAKTSETKADQAKLTVEAAQLNGKSGTAEFYKGRALTLENGSVTMVQSDGSSQITLAAGNEEMKVTSPTGNLPYQIFTVKTGTVKSTDRIAANWDGNASYADETHATAMYVYNTKENRWELLKKADDTGSIKAEFQAENHVVQDTAYLLVQCRSAGTPQVSPGKAKSAALSGWEGTLRPEQYDFSMAWITDTQYYAETWHDHFSAQNQWIVNNALDWKIRYTIHTGDIVDEWDMQDQWQRADQAMKIFDDNNIPYGVLAGNHDVAAGNEYYNNYWNNFGEDRFSDKDYYGESYKNNLGHYDLLTENGQDLIILYMSWDIYQEEIDWMNQVLEQYKDRKAILCFHRYANVKITDDSILDYAGKVIQENVVAKNENVIAVLNGHYHGASIQVDEFQNADGTQRLVYQICTDYQSDPEGGSEYIKFLYFDLQNDKIYMNSYSPAKEDFNYFDSPKLESYGAGTVAINQDIYELDVDFDTSAKSLETRRFAAAVYTDELIGRAPVSNGKAEFNYSGLSPETGYGWYAKVTNDNTGTARSDVDIFYTTKKQPEPSRPEPPKPQPPKPDEPSEPVAPEVTVGNTALKVTASSYNSLKLTWKKAKNASGYIVYRSDKKNGKYKVAASIKKGSQTSYTDKKRKSGKTYYYKIRAFGYINNKKKYGSYSAIKSCKVVPGEVKIASVSNKKAKSLSIKWKKTDGADGYKIYRAAGKNGTFKKIKTIKVTNTKRKSFTFTDSGLKKGKTYYYKIRAYRKSGKTNITGKTGKVISKKVTR